MTARKVRVSQRLRQRVAKAAGYCCGYCRTPERIAGFRLSIEHIIPEARGGQTVEANLWLACHACNEGSPLSLRFFHRLLYTCVK
jgi:5-methylcytosine-specific restriction endonuclease McrA